MSLNCSPEMLTSRFQKIFFIIFLGVFGSKSSTGGQFEPEAYRLQRVGWIYVVNHCALLQLNIKATGFMVSEDFLKVFPYYKEANDRPSGHGQVESQGHVGMIYAGDQKTLIYTKYINYWPHRKDFHIFFSITSL